MGTNYYLKRKICACCGKAGETLHIGKSSGGWCFSLHIYPEDSIQDLQDWQMIFCEADSKIENEYGDLVSGDKMLKEITERSWKIGIAHTKSFLDSNYANPGPNGLLRHRIDGKHCVSHGDGTWDCIVGDFS